MNTFKFNVTSTLNVAMLKKNPQELPTLMVPEVAPIGTVAVMVVSFTTTNAALVPLNFTEEEELNPVPLMVTTVPIEPLAGKNDVIIGT